MFLILLSAWALFSCNPAESLLGLFTLYLILKLFWKPNLVFILPYCLLWHWLEIYTSVWEANYFGLTLNENFPDTGRETAWLAGLGLLSVIGGLYLSVNGKTPSIRTAQIQQAARRIQLRPLLATYGIFFLLDIAISQIAFRFPAFTQLLIHFSNLKLVFFILVSYWVFVKRSHYLILILVALLEFISGLYSFFSDFKIVFIVLGITFVLTIHRLSFGRIMLLGSLFSLAVVSLFYWQVIKAQYRGFLNQGTDNIVVNTSFSESISKIRDLSAGVSSEDIEPVLKAAFRRLGYLEFFSRTLKFVPNSVPHEKGALLWQNINFAFVPRILNPDKGIKNDRAKLEKYAGIAFWTSGSFSLSYYAEAYVDFGRGGMMVFLFVLGWLAGKLFLRCIFRYQLNLLLIYAIAIVVMLPFASYGADAVVLFGQLVWGAVSHLIIFSPVYRLINRFLE